MLGRGKSVAMVSTSTLLSGSGASWLRSGPDTALTMGFRVSAGCVHAATPIYGIATDASLGKTFAKQVEDGRRRSNVYCVSFEDIGVFVCERREGQEME